MINFKTIFIFVLCLSAIFYNGEALAYPSTISDTSGVVNDLSNLINNTIRNTLSGVGDKYKPSINSVTPINTQINLKEFFSTKNVSSQDFILALKSALILLINIFLLVLGILIQILKVFLSFLSP